MATMPYKSLLIALLCRKGKLAHYCSFGDMAKFNTFFQKFSGFFEKFSKNFFSIFQKFSLYYVILSIKNSKLTKKSKKKNFQKNFSKFSKFFCLLPIGLRKHLENFWKNFQKIAHFSKTTHLTKMATMPYKSLLIALLCRKGKTCSLL